MTTEEARAREVLKPCPFCREREKLEPVSDGVTDWIVCRKCGCDGPVMRGAEARDRAWNTRPTATGGAEDVRQFINGMIEAATICGTLAETTYDDTDAFAAATGCEAAIHAAAIKLRRALPVEPASASGEAERRRIINEAKRTLQVVQGCLECSAEEERHWVETIRWLESV